MAGDDPSGLREAGEWPAPADLGLRAAVPAATLRRASQSGEPQPVASYRGPVEPPEPDRTGICCSGGGIRSAAFNLGALQSLHKTGELPAAQYLAAVSGGSYICAAFSMVGKRWAGASRPPDGEDGHDDSNPDLLASRPPFAPGSPEEQYLRNRTTYMAPDGRSKLYLGIRVVVGLLFNLFLLALPIFVVTVVGGLLVAPFLDGLRPGCGEDCGFDPPWWLWVAPLVILALGLLVALARVIRRAPSEAARIGSERLSTGLVMLAAAVAAVGLLLPELVEAIQPKEVDDTNVVGEAQQAGGASGAGLAALIAGVLAALRAGFASPKAVAGTVGKTRKFFAKLSERLRGLLILVAATLAGPVLVLAIATFVLSLTLTNYESFFDPIWLPGAALLALILFVGIYAFLDITSLSLHPFYKRRLCSAYALKRVKPSDIPGDRAGAGVPQEAAQGIAMERDYGRLVTLSGTALDKWPALIVCAAANVSDAAATPPGRPITSFTFSANTVGGPLVGAMRTSDYEDIFDPEGDGSGRNRDVTLPAAVAMSGAALAPAMGKLAPRSYAFLLALANIRLGVWLPNPRWAATIDKDEPEGRRELDRYGRPRPLYLFREMLGRNSLRSRYLYVSDGGHYENLGLVELLRRGCTRVFCLDASGGRPAGELGDAVALARSELGVEVDIDPSPLTPKGEPPTAAQDTVRGTLRYPDGTRGTIVYAANVMTPREPWDVRAHQLEDPRFPHDSTLDQLYTDQKFESYRRLGFEAGEHATARMAEVSPRPGSAPADGAIAPAAVKIMFDEGALQLVDVRDGFAHDLVHIEGALHIALSELLNRISELRREHPVVFLCEEGNRSSRVAGWFAEDGWEAHHVDGGISRWIEEDLPVKRPGD